MPMRFLGVIAFALLCSCVPRASVLVVAVDGADWRIVEILTEHGHLPSFERLIQRGAAGALDCRPAAPAWPCFSPRVWGTMMSGVPAVDHGIMQLQSRSDDWRVPALWHLLAREGGTSTVIGMFGSWPPDPDVTVSITEPGLDLVASAAFDPWPWPPDHPGILDFASLVEPAGLLERLLRVRERSEHPPVYLPIARDRVAMAALRRLERRRPLPTDLTLIYLGAVDKAEHITWGLIQETYQGPIDEELVLEWARRWQEAEPGDPMAGPIEGPAPFSWGNVASQYLEIDRWLRRLLRVRSYDYVVLLSDHGMGRNPFPGGPGVHNWTTPEALFSFFVMAGPGVQQGAWIEGSVLDVAPTLAYLLGLPVAEDLEGRVLEEAFTPRRLARLPVATVASWGDSWGED